MAFVKAQMLELNITNQSINAWNATNGDSNKFVNIQPKFAVLSRINIEKQFELDVINDKSAMLVGCGYKDELKYR